MKAIIYNEYGGIEVLKMEELPMPNLKKNQTLIKIKSVSINPLDWKIRKGEMKMMSGSKFPKQIGVDFSGVIEKIDPSVTKFKIGDEVFGAVNGMKEGALAEYIAIDTNSIWLKPKQMSFEQASSVPTIGAAAYKAIEELANVSSGTEILINGCTGGVGMLAIQLAKQKGAKVTGVCGTNGIEFAKKWGCDTVVDYSKTDVRNLAEQFDIVLELSGKLNFKEAKKIMKPHSVFINPIPKFVDILQSPFVNIGASKKYKILLGSPSIINMNFIIKAIEKGLNIEISKTFEFANYKEAYRFAEKGGFIGKLTVRI
jgi:NADPH:quinone reductase-like Zn-dependent oxidoreductase